MMRPAHGDVLYDMGSGAGRFVVHAALALPHVRVVGVELSSVRHSVAFAASKRAALTNLHVIHGDMLTSPCEDATLVYFASLLFDARFIRQLCSRFEAQAPRLRMFVTLLAIPKGALPSFALTAVEPALSVTWGHARAFVYTRRSATIEEPQPTTDPCAADDEDELRDRSLRAAAQILNALDLTNLRVHHPHGLCIVQRSEAPNAAD